MGEGGGAGQRTRGFWAKIEGGLGKERRGSGSGQRKAGSALRLGGSCRALHVVWRRLQGDRRLRGAVVVVARLEKTGGDWGTGGRGWGWAGVAASGRQVRAWPGLVVGGWREVGRAGVMGTSRMCLKSCKRFRLKFGVKNARGENLSAKKEGFWPSSGASGQRTNYFVFTNKFHFFATKAAFSPEPPHFYAAFLF